VRLGVNPKHADQMVRGAIVLPHGTGKGVRVACSRAARRKRRLAMRAPISSGGEDPGGRRSPKAVIEFDRVIADPDMMGIVGQAGSRARSARSHAEPQGRHRSHGRRERRPGGQGR
jgi:large subunit ribosomal protein L1